MPYARDGEAGKKAAGAVLDKYLDGELDQVNKMALVLVAAQILAKEKQTGKFASALKQALKDKMWAKRVTADEPDITKATVGALLDGLSHRTDGRLRPGCYTALAAISGQDHFCDWLFASQDAADIHAKKYCDRAKQRK